MSCATIASASARTTGRQRCLKEAAPPIEELISMRNAVEHPDGYSGKLVVANFTLGADRRIDGPT
jgi:hypothetical protein